MELKVKKSSPIPGLLGLTSFLGLIMYITLTHGQLLTVSEVKSGVTPMSLIDKTAVKADIKSDRLPASVAQK